MITIHIGTDKTGSTAIQKMLFWNREFLKSKGFLYPKTGMMHYDHARLNIELNKQNFSILEKLKEEIMNEKVNNIILSHEGFYHMNQETLKYFYTYLNSLNKGNIKIIIYLRRQDEMIESGILQQVKTNEIIFDPQIKEIPYFAHLDYYHIVKKFDNIFGTENVILRPYSKKYLPSSDSLLKDFYNCFTSKKDFSFTELNIVKKDQNPSLDVVSLHTISFLHKIGLEKKYYDDIIDQLLYLQLKYGKSKKKIFSKNQRINLLKKYKNNEKLKNRIPEDLFNIDENEKFEEVLDSEVAERLKMLYQRKRYLIGSTSFYGERGNLISKINNKNIILQEGWYDIEPWGIWSNGNKISKLSFRIARTKIFCTKIRIEIENNYLHDQAISYVRYNENHDWIKIEKERMFFEVDTSDIRENGHLVFLEFKHENIKTPKELDSRSADIRVIGIGIRDISFEEVL